MRASLVCFKKVSKVGRTSSGKCNLRGRMRVVSTIKYYNNIQILRHTMCLPSYRNKAFPTQIFRKLLKVLGFEKGRPFGEFRRIILQDGSSFAIHDGLREVFPGRFKVLKPAAIELHATMDLLCDAPTTVVLTPDTANEQAFLPEPATLTGSLLLADRGYIDLHYMRRVQDEGGFCLIRAKAGMNPHVLEAFREDGTRVRSLRN